MTLSKVHPATMNTMKLAAIVLFGLGISIFAYQGARDKQGVAVPRQQATEPSDTFLLLPMVGAIALFGGAVLMFAGDRRR